jgi:anaerobic dimethyl sulfoxide reductase subunit B (iron-sulfur subunit)
VACQQEHDFPVGKCGIKVSEHVYEAIKKPVAIDFLPFPTELCDLCINRHKEGQKPACVKHCQSFCMTFGDLEELVKEMASKPRSVLFSPK